VPASIPPDIEEYRNERWHRELTRQVSGVSDAEQFVQRVGFCGAMTDARRPGPSLYVAVCGRPDAVLPRNIQTDEETSTAWHLKDDLLRRGKVYYGKLARGRPMFLAPRMIGHFNAVWGVRASAQSTSLSAPARAILKALRREWELGTADLRKDSGVTDRKVFGRALDELQAALLVVPSDVVYTPSFTYLWTLAVGRFPEHLRTRGARAVALKEIARCFLDGAGMTFPGELARVTGLSRVEAGLGNRALVAEGYAVSPARGVYRLATLTRARGAG
jgi:hypothetical protein